MNNQDYRSMVDDVAENLPGQWQRIGNRQVKQLPAAGANVEQLLQFPPGDPRQGLRIIYRRHDIYIRGYRTAAGVAYACNNQMANVAGATNLGFDDAYGTLGWNRQVYTINRGAGPQVTVPLLDIALNAAANGAASRGDMLRIVVALAEGVRFMSVERAIRGALPITTDMVDWAQQLAANDAVLRQG
ncbi:MAG: ribosome-inactivating family protein [Reyranellaceae bacterium]